MRRGQNAIEFMLTYAWALAIVAVVIGLLVVLGLPNLSDNEPERCSFVAGSFGCSNLLVIMRDHPTYGNIAVMHEYTLTNNLNKPVIVCSALWCSAEPTGADGIPKSMRDFFNGRPHSCSNLVGTSQELKPGESRGFGYQEGGGWYCYDSDGELSRLPVGSLYRGKLYVAYSYADEPAPLGGNRAQHIAVADVVSRVERGG